MKPLTKQQRAAAIARGAKYRAAHKAAGLRSDGKPLAPRKPCGCLSGCCLKCSRPTNGLYWSDAEVAAMRVDYERGLTASAVERKHGVPNKGLRDIFRNRNIPWRECTLRRPRFDGRRFVADPPKTEKELAAMIAELKTVKVPTALKAEWKRWPMAKRGAFIARVRAHLVKNYGKTFAPTGPHSANVVPFDYATPAARAIVDAANAGRTSQTRVMSLKPSSQGMIYRGELYFWAYDGYARQLHKHPEDGPGGQRPMLHRLLYKKFHGRIPAGHTVIFKDGNKNNFTDQNLALRSMADCAKQNAWHRRPEQFLGLMDRAAAKAWETKNKKRLQRQRGMMAALLQPAPATNLLAELNRR